MTLLDALTNWLQLKLVYDTRPHDESAKISLDHVEDILNEVYHIQTVKVTRDEEELYTVSCVVDKQNLVHRFPTEVAETLLQFILQNPTRYDFTT